MAVLRAMVVAAAAITAAVLAVYEVRLVERMLEARRAAAIVPPMGLVVASRFEVCWYAARALSPERCVAVPYKGDPNDNVRAWSLADARSITGIHQFGDSPLVPHTVTLERVDRSGRITTLRTVRGVAYYDWSLRDGALAGTRRAAAWRPPSQARVPGGVAVLDDKGVIDRVTVFERGSARPRWSRDACSSGGDSRASELVASGNAIAVICYPMASLITLGKESVIVFDARTGDRAEELRDAPDGATFVRWFSPKAGS